jgi:hypothetical protein
MNVNVRAFRVVHQAINGVTPIPSKQASARNRGLKGGPARARSITPERRTEIARTTSAARWQKQTPSELP